MEITWTEPDVKCELVVRWWSAMENSMGSRSATLADLKRANEAAGLPSDYISRDEAIAREEKLKVRLAVLEAEQAAYLDALAVDGCRPSNVLVGIESLKSALDAESKELADADALISRVSARAEKAEGNLAAAQRRIAELEGERSIAAAIRKSEDATWNNLTARAADSEDRASELARENDVLRKRIADLEAEHDLANGVNRRAAQSVIECIGSVGPEDADSAAERIVSRVIELEAERDGARSIISVVDKVLTEEARHPQSNDLVARVRGLAAQANGLAAIVEERGKIITELEAQLQAAQDTSIADRAMDKFYAEGIDPHGVLHGIDLAIERAKKAEAERDLAKHDFELANEAYDELHARFDELASSPERIALLEALEPHDPNAARAAAVMKREHEAALAVLGAREGEDLLSAAKRAVVLADVYRAHYRRAVISNFTTDRAMTEGLAECERLRARIAELEAVAAERESLREAVWEFERLLRERVGGKV